jgi:hypothetical protein
MPNRGIHWTKTIVEPKWSQKGTFLQKRARRQKKRALEVFVREPFRRIAGTGFEPVTFGL